MTHSMHIADMQLILDRTLQINTFANADDTSHTTSPSSCWCDWIPVRSFYTYPCIKTIIIINNGVEYES